MTTKKPYFDNNWELYHQSDDDLFIPHTYDDFMMWKGEAWDLPSSVCCMIRTTDTKTGKVKEFIYRRKSAAAKKVEKLLDEDNIEFVVCKHDTMHFVQPDLLDDYEIYDSEATD